MSATVSRDVGYVHDGDRMLGALVSSRGDRALPTVLLLHDAFGLNADTLAIAHRVAERGFTVFAADVWGKRRTPSGEEIGPMIGAMAGDRMRWHGRLLAGLEAAASQPETDASAVIALGYCFGGSGALELLRIGGELRAAASIHGGLDLLAPDWSLALPGSDVLLVTGADDPMGTPAQCARLTAELDAARIDWELDVYSGTVHAFTNPRSAHALDPSVVAYHPRSAARAWAATERFLAEMLGEA
ncbi:dienelactone hydrolase family protein [Microbacterium sp. NPDC055903]